MIIRLHLELQPLMLSLLLLIISFSLRLTESGQEEGQLLDVVEELLSWLSPWVIRNLKEINCHGLGGFLPRAYSGYKLSRHVSDMNVLTIHTPLPGFPTLPPATPYLSQNNKLSHSTKFGDSL